MKNVIEFDDMSTQVTADKDLVAKMDIVEYEYDEANIDLKGKEISRKTVEITLDQYLGGIEAIKNHLYDAFNREYKGHDLGYQGEVYDSVIEWFAEQWADEASEDFEVAARNFKLSTNTDRIGSEHTLKFEIFDRDGDIRLQNSFKVTVTSCCDGYPDDFKDEDDIIDYIEDLVIEKIQKAGKVAAYILINEYIDDIESFVDEIMDDMHTELMMRGGNATGGVAPCFCISNLKKSAKEKRI